MAPLAVPIVGGLFRIGEALIERLFPDPTARDKARLELLAMQQAGELQTISVQMQAIVAEANSESWIARNWRPITMLCFVSVIVNNYLLVPYLTMFGAPAVTLDLPVNVWDIIEFGLGGYVLGRSAEKVAETVATTFKKSK